MKKMSLKLDELMVESFQTTDPAGDRGTVLAHESETDLVSCTSCGETYCGPSCEFCSGGNTCNGCTGTACPTFEPTCEYTSPNPEGTCCGLTC